MKKSMTTEQLITALSKYPKDSIPVIQLEADTMMSFDIGRLMTDGNMIVLDYGNIL